MNIKEQIAKLKAEMVGLKEAIKGGDQQAIQRAGEIKDEIAALEAKLKEAEMAEEFLKQMGGYEEEVKKGAHGEKAAKSLGEHVVKSAKGMKRGIQGSVSTPEFKAATDVSVTKPRAGYLTNYDEEIDGVRRKLSVFDLFRHENVTKGNSVSFFVETPMEGSIAAIGENGKYPQVHFGDPVEKNVPLRKIGAIYKESDELLDDDKRLADNINGRALYELDLQAENQLINGDGKNVNVNGILTTEGMQSYKIPSGTDILDALLHCKTLVKKGSAYNADGIIINPVDYEKLRLAKDKNGQYFAGGAFTGAYGNGTYAAEPAPWGLRVAESDAIPEGKMVIGAFGTAGTIYLKGGVAVDITNTNDNDFEYGRISVRPSRRFNLGIKRPSAFVIAEIQKA